MNPYWDNDFFTFFSTLFSRLFSFAFLEPTSDEIQIGVLSLIAISCGLIGPFLVLRKMAMFANALSHTVLVGIIVSFLWIGGSSLFDFSHLFIGALIASVLTVFLTEGLIQWFHLHEDASVGLIFTTLFALGIVLATVCMRDVHLGIESVMGNSDALQLSDLKTSAILALMNGLAVLLFYPFLRISSFDAPFAKCLGLPVRFVHFALLFFVAMTVVGAFRSVGVLLVLSFLVCPYLIARLLSDRLGRILLYTPLIGVVSVFLGVALSRHILSVYGLPLSTGGILVTLMTLLYVLSIAWKSRKFLFTQRMKFAIVETIN